MKNLERALKASHRVQIPPDEHGYTGRECPECKAYFKVIFGTGLEGVTDCICPYCGHKADANEFWTEAQIEYAQSVVLNKLTGALLKDFKSLETKHRPRQGMFGISIKATGRPQPIRYYQEKQLETEIVCEKCTLAYAVYGVFAFCPDCGTHNSRQILQKNLELAQKELDLATQVEAELAAHLTSDALKNVVSTFDGFGRETCRVNAVYASNSNRAENLSFQNLSGAQTNVQQLFGIDLAQSLSAHEWETALRCFQKRHLIAHKMGVIDTHYIQNANDPGAVVGHKVTVNSGEVSELADVVTKMGQHLSDELSKLASSTNP